MSYRVVGRLLSPTPRQAAVVLQRPVRGIGCKLLIITATLGLLLMHGSEAHSQLSVLSQGNKQSQWKASQVAALEQQLADPKLVPELKLELSSQLKWLNAWQPGKLTEEVLWTTEDPSELWVEPFVDPNGTASALRERLLGPEAKPTAEDTAELKKLLAEHDNDLGVRQLHLHWLDQSQYRKLYPQEIADAASKVLALLDGAAKQTEEVRLARSFCLYRRGRALAYRELPDVLAKKPLDEAELQKNEADLVGVYRQLKTLVAEPRPEFILLDVRMLRHDRWNGRALTMLEDFGDRVTKQWFLKKRRDVLTDLGWEGPAKEAATIYAAAFPDEVAKEKEAASEM